MTIEILKQAPTMPDGPDAFMTISERAVSGAVFAVHVWL